MQLATPTTTTATARRITEHTIIYRGYGIYYEDHAPNGEDNYWDERHGLDASITARDSKDLSRYYLIRYSTSADKAAAYRIS